MFRGKVIKTHPCWRVRVPVQLYWISWIFESRFAWLDHWSPDMRREPLTEALSGAIKLNPDLTSATSFLATQVRLDEMTRRKSE